MCDTAKNKIVEESTVRSQLRMIMCLFLVILAYQCGKGIPVEEMGNSKYLITKAEGVKADEYAPEKYESAKKALFEAHELISKGDMSGAKEKAILAGKLAQEAFDLSIPKLAQESKENAEALIKEADDLLAIEFAEEEFKNSKDFLLEGDDYVKNSNYLNATKSYEKSAESAGNAKNISEAQIELIKSSSLEIEDKLKQAEEYGASKKYPEKLERAKKDLATANELLSAKNYKEARPLLEKVGKLAQEIFDNSLRTWAGNLYQEAKEYVEKVDAELMSLVQQIGNDPNLKKKFDSDEEKKNTLESTQVSMDAAKEALANAAKLLTDSIYQESKDESEEANRLAKIVQDQLAQIRVLAKDGVGSLSSLSTTSSMGEGWKQYVVKNRPSKRDCLWRISGYKDIYRNPRLWPRIYKANKSKIRNPDLIYPGQKFDIPPKEGSMSKKSGENKRPLGSSASTSDTDTEPSSSVEEK